jgi:hypothetical protein
VTVRRPDYIDIEPQLVVASLDQAGVEGLSSGSEYPRRSEAPCPRSLPEVGDQLIIEPVNLIN